MRHGFYTQDPLIKMEVKDYFLPMQGVWFDGLVKLNIPITIATLGTYRLAARVRVGDYSNDRKYKDKYIFYMNNTLLPMVLDEASVVKVDGVYGNGSYMGDMVANVTYKQVVNMFTVEPKERFTGVGWVEDGQPEGLGGFTQAQVAEQVKLATAGMFTQIQMDAYAAEKVKIATSGMYTAVEKQAAYDLGFKEGDLQGTTKERAIWVDRIKPLSSVKTAADGIKAVIDAVIS